MERNAHGVLLGGRVIDLAPEARRPAAKQLGGPDLFLNPSSSVAEVLLLPINGLRDLSRVFRHYIGNGARAFGQA